ncbi:MAG: gamma-glutamyltransferase [Deltaproteobacteria bacterium]|nr:gamma-glutamyltransferase [Deltaproteobacteria bacterium]
MVLRPSVVLALGFLVAAWVALAAAPIPERGDAMVSSSHALASEAGASVLRRGGNAADAAVATALAAGVVQPSSSGLGGGGFAIWVDRSERAALDFREVAPAAAYRDMFRTEDGVVDPTASRVGGRAVAVPGEPRGLADLLAAHGSLPPSVVAAPAIELASRGFPVGRHLHAALERTPHEGVGALLGIGDALPRPGERVRRATLAKTLKRWASSRGGFFYEGPGAAALVEAVGEAGGAITAEDLERYASTPRKPVIVQYRGYTVIGMSPPSSGGVALGQMLQVLERYDLKALGHNSSDYVHLLTETMKHVFADRARFLGDPDFVEVPVERLLSKERIGEVQRAIWPGRTFGPDHYGEPIAPHRDAGTQHISVVDAQGRAVALTTTINTSFGSGLVVGPLGIVLNNEMDDFASAPGVPNAYGLVGSEANAVAPGKRPLSSMTPTVVLDPEGEVVMALGASGGSFIISAVLQVFLDVVEFGLDPQEAVAAPRFHHQWVPDQLFLEPGFPADVQRALEARGHTLTERDGFSSVQVVLVEGDHLAGGADPRTGGWPAGVWGVVP